MWRSMGGIDGLVDRWIEWSGVWSRLSGTERQRETAQHQHRQTDEHADPALPSSSAHTGGSGKGGEAAEAAGNTRQENKGSE